MHKKNAIRVALAGQPNCGKSTMFNVLTGSTARVGNYPGITVDRMEGHCKTENHKIKFIDLPGTYSLTSYSPEEVVARDVILHERPDVVVCMLDSSALERSLYLVIQIIEIGVPIVIGLNMMDEVKRDGIQINSARLAEKLNVPVIECVARRGIGREEMLKAIVSLYENEGKWKPHFNISYGMDIDLALDGMEKLIVENKFMTAKYPARWLAIKYMEGDSHIIDEGRKFSDLSQKLESAVKSVEVHIEKSLKTYPEAIIADYRYGFIASLLKGGIILRTDEFRRNFSETLDKVLTHRLFGPLAMIGVLYLLFWVTFTAGSYPQEWLQSCFGYIGGLGNKYITNDLLRSLIVSGIIDGVGAVLSFAPLILIMFAMLCFLEDLGYMARVAYMLDKIFKTFGLHGASVMPFIIAGGIPGGCAVPGVMAARTLKSPKERIATILTAPFMVCGAKTTVYLMLAGTFFPRNETIVMLFLTIGSWIFALLVSCMLRKTILRGKATPFIMELPPYRLPTVYGIATHTLDRVWQFVKKAGTVIFAVSIAMWCLMTFPRLPENQNAVQSQSLPLSLSLEPGEQQSLAAVEKKVGGRLGVAALDTATDRRIEYRSGERFAMCSTFKLLLVAAILERVDSGHESLDRIIPYKQSDLLDWAPVTRNHMNNNLNQGAMSILELCDATIKQSDNTAANLLLKTIGGPEAYTVFVRSLQDSVTRLDRNEPALNNVFPGDKRDTTSPSAMLNSMRNVLIGPVLSEQSRRQLTKWMKECKTGTARLRAGLPSTWEGADKTGTGEHSVSDIAIAWPPGCPPILIAAYLSECHSPLQEREAALAEAARIVIASLFKNTMTEKTIHLQQSNNKLEALKYSFAGRLGIAFEHITQYAGFQWQTNIALIGGVAAKEIILSTLSTAYSLGSQRVKGNEQNSSNLLKQKLLNDPHWSLPAILSVFLFMLLYAPCLTTVVAIAKETSWKWAIGGTAGSLVLAYILSVIVYQFGSYLLN